MSATGNSKEFPQEGGPGKKWEPIIWDNNFGEEENKNSQVQDQESDENSNEKMTSAKTSSSSEYSIISGTSS